MKERGGQSLKYLYRAGIHYYIIGIIVLTFGIGLAIISMLGTSPFDALLVGLHRTFGLTIGSFEIVVGLSMIIGNAIAARKRPEFFALITSLLTGAGIDGWYFFLKYALTVDTILVQSICLVASLFFMGLGVAIYLHSNIAPNPMDRTMLLIHEFTGWNFTYSRALINVILIMLAFIFGGAIGIGTLINAIFGGTFINLFMPLISKLKAYEVGLIEERHKLIKRA